MELAFIVFPKEQMFDAKTSSFESNIRVEAILNKNNMILEDVKLESFINKGYLKQKFINEEFNLFITSMREEQIE